MKKIIVTAGLLFAMAGAGWALVYKGSTASEGIGVSSNPIPAPSTVVLLGSGLLGLVYLGSIRRRK